MLLEIPGIQQRFGVLKTGNSAGDGNLLRKPEWKDLTTRKSIESPLMTVAQRIAVNRERIGVHYTSDSYGSRHLAAGLWDALMNRPIENESVIPPGDKQIETINCPTLNTIIEHAKSEWPTPWN